MTSFVTGLLSKLYTMSCLQW